MYFSRLDWNIQSVRGNIQKNTEISVTKGGDISIAGMAAPNNLRHLRQAAGISVAALSRASSVSDKTIRKTENRIIDPRRETKARMINGLNDLTKQNYSYSAVFPNG